MTVITSIRNMHPAFTGNSPIFTILLGQQAFFYFEQIK